MVAALFSPSWLTGRTKKLLVLRVDYLKLDGVDEKHLAAQESQASLRV